MGEPEGFSFPEGPVKRRLTGRNRIWPKRWHATGEISAVPPGGENKGRSEGVVGDIRCRGAQMRARTGNGRMHFLPGTSPLRPRQAVGGDAVHSLIAREIGPRKPIACSPATPRTRWMRGVGQKLLAAARTLDASGVAVQCRLFVLHAARLILPLPPPLFPSSR